MIYRFVVNTPKNTAKDSPKVTTLKLTRGVIHAVMIGFPPGPQDLLHCTLWREGHQVWPTEPADDFAWEEFTFVWEDRLPMEAEPYQMQAVTWNESTRYAHRVFIALAILRQEELQTAREELGILKRLERLIFGAPERTV